MSDQLNDLRERLAAAEAALVQAKQGAKEARVAENSAAQIGDAIREAATRWEGMVKNDKIVFADFAHRSSAEIQLRWFVEMSDELRSPGSTKWGTPEAQEHYKSLRAANTALQEQVAQQKAKLDYVHSMGLRFGMMKSSDKPDPYLMHTWTEDSDHEQMFREWSASIGWEHTVAKLESANTALSAQVEELKRDGENKGGSRVLSVDKWDWKMVGDLYHADGHALIDFLVNEILSELNKQLGGKGWEAYESDGTLEEAVSYEINTLLKKNQAVEEWEGRPMGPLLMGLIRLSDNESKKGKFRVTLDYDNHNDGARVLDGNGKNIGECYEDRAGNTDEDGPDNQFVGAIIKAIDAARAHAKQSGQQTAGQQ